MHNLWIKVSCKVNEISQRCKQMSHFIWQTFSYVANVICFIGILNYTTPVTQRTSLHTTATFYNKSVILYCWIGCCGIPKYQYLSLFFLYWFIDIVLFDISINKNNRLSIPQQPIADFMTIDLHVLLICQIVNNYWTRLSKLSGFIIGKQINYLK